MADREGVRWADKYPGLWGRHVDRQSAIERKPLTGATGGVFGDAATLPPDLLGNYWDEANDRSPKPPRIEPKKA